MRLLRLLSIGGIRKLFLSVLQLFGLHSERANLLLKLLYCAAFLVHRLLQIVAVHAVLGQLDVLLPDVRHLLFQLLVYLELTVELDLQLSLLRRLEFWDLAEVYFALRCLLRLHKLPL